MLCAELEEDPNRAFRCPDCDEDICHMVDVDMFYEDEDEGAGAEGGGDEGGAEAVAESGPGDTT